MALPVAQPKLAANLEAHYQHLLTCPEMVDTRDHLPLFRSLSGSILEIGCDCGNSTTAFLLSNATKVTSIDINPLCRENFPDSEKWRFVEGDSKSPTTFGRITGDFYDVLFVDGAHDYDSAVSDLFQYSVSVRPGGIIFVHDILAFDMFPGVWKAFNEFRWYSTGGRVSCKYVLPGSYGLGVIEL